MIARYAAVALAVVAIGGRLDAQIVNGGFEVPVQANGSYSIFNTGDTFPGWTVVGDPGNVAIVNGAFSQFGVSFPAHSGSQWLDLTGLSNTATGVQQTFATFVGQRYNLSFWVGNVSGSIFGVTSTINVQLNGSAFFVATNATPGTTQSWQQFTTSFTATSGLTSLAFVNADPASDNSNGLDDVAVSPAQSVTTTPEPSETLLVATGFVGLFVAARRRGSRAG